MGPALPVHHTPFALSNSWRLPNPNSNPTHPNPTPPRLPQQMQCNPFPGEVTLEDFIAFAQRKTWGQEELVDPFTALLPNDGMEGNEPGEGDGETGGECSDSDGEDAR